MFCSNCGNKLADGAKFCSECGARVAPADEQGFRTIADIDLNEPELTDEIVEPKEEIAEIPESTPRVELKREHISFDWSNVVDEPHRKEVQSIKSPWEDTGEIDEQELFAEMSPSTDKSRTMSFIDVLRAEKEEKERAAADSAIEYTEVLEIGHDLSSFDEPPELRYAPLYEDVNEPVKTPFDRPDDEQSESEAAEEPRFETQDASVMTGKKAAEAVEEPEEPKVELSRETIAQFEEYVKSFEKEAGIANDEPRVDRPLSGVSMPRFELPDFLKKSDEREGREPFSEIDSKPAGSAEPDELFEEYDIKFDEELDDGPDLDIPSIEETPEQPFFEEPKYEDYSDGFDFIDDDIATGAEDLYLDLENLKDEPSAEVKSEQPVEEETIRPKHGAAEESEETEEAVEIVEEAEAEEAEDSVNEEELFREMTESSPKHSGMTIAEPADTQAEIDALKRRLAELMGTPVEGLSIEAEAETHAGEEPEITIDETSEDEEPEEEAPATEPASEEIAEPVAEAAAEAEPEAEETPLAETEPEVEEAPFAEEIPAEEPAEGVEISEFEPDLEVVDYDLYLEPESTSGVHDLFEGLTPASQPQVDPEEEVAAAEPASEEIAEPVAEAAAEAEPEAEESPLAETEPEVEEAPFAEEIPAEETELIIEEAAEEAAPVEEPAEAAEPVVEKAEEVAPAAEPAVEEIAAKSEPSVDDLFEELMAANKLQEEPAVEATPLVEPFEEVQTEPVVEEIAEIIPATEPVAETAPVVEEVVEEAVEAEPEELPSDALSLEELEKDLFGDVPEGEVEETKKIDKFYTLYKKNEEFQRLLDEEYQKLKNGGSGTVEPEETETVREPEAAAEQPAEDKKAYRQVEDETIYMSKEDIEKQVSQELKAETKPATVAAATAVAATAGAVFHAKTSDSAPVELDANLTGKEKKAADKAAKKAEKAARKAGKSDSYNDPDAGNGVLTVLAVIIAIILVILLAVIVIMSVAPNSGIGIWINGHIQQITSGIGAVFPGDRQSLI